MGLETVDTPHEANIFYVSQQKKQREGRRPSFIQRKHIKVNGKCHKEGPEPLKGNTEKISVLR